jgi:hypothetical protein
MKKPVFFDPDVEYERADWRWATGTQTQSQIKEKKKKTQQQILCTPLGAHCFVPHLFSSVKKT